MRSFRTLWQRIHTKVPQTNYCTSTVKRRMDRQTEWGIAIALIQIHFLNTGPPLLKTWGPKPKSIHWPELVRVYICRRFENVGTPTSKTRGGGSEPAHYLHVLGRNKGHCFWKILSVRKYKLWYAFVVHQNDLKYNLQIAKSYQI